MEKTLKNLGFLAMLLMIVNACTTEKVPEIRNPKNIILLIGDGMGVSQVYAGYTANHGKLNLERMPITGFSITYSSSDYITDSGAGGTALSTGYKTYNGAIGVGPDSLPVTTILELSEKEGKATGLVSTSSITHATPASFIAHQKSRNYYEAIAKDFLNTDIDVFIGGGYNNFAKRSDSADLTNELIKRGYEVIKPGESFAEVKSGKLAGLLALNHLPKASDGRGSFLKDATVKAIELLSQDEDGFFLMIEGSQIDWGGHANDLQYIVDEMVDFDSAIGAALDFAENNDETLVIVTADHETGGLALTEGNIESGELSGSFPSTDHTSVMVPVFCYGPFSGLFSGIQQNTDIFKKMHEAFGFEIETQDDKQ